MANWRSGPDASADVADNAVFLTDPLPAGTSPRNGYGGGVLVDRDVACQTLRPTVATRNRISRLDNHAHSTGRRRISGWPR